MAVPLAEGARVVRAGQADVLDQARHPAARRPADPPGRRRRAARPARAPQARARRRGAVRRRAQAAAAVPAPPGRPGLRPGAAPPRRTSSRTPGAAGPRCGSRSARSPVQGPDTRSPRSAPRCASWTPTRASTSSSSPAAAARVEDLLPFSNEALVRAVAAARTPVVSAIGHDVDTPLLDLVADVARLDADRRGQAGRARRWPSSAPRVGRHPRPAAPGRRAPGRAPSAGTWRVPAQPAGHGRPRPPWSRARREELDALTGPGPPPRAGRRAPCRRPGRAPARAGARPVPAVHARARLRRRAARRRPRRHGPRTRSRPDELLRVRVARGDFGVRPVSWALPAEAVGARAQAASGTTGRRVSAWQPTTLSPCPTAAPEFPDIAELTYEQARDELIAIVAQLEGGQIGLEDSMAAVAARRGPGRALQHVARRRRGQARRTPAVTRRRTPPHRWRAERGAAQPALDRCRSGARAKVDQLVVRRGAGEDRGDVRRALAPVDQADLHLVAAADLLPRAAGRLSVPSARPRLVWAATQRGVAPWVCSIAMYCSSGEM